MARHNPLLKGYSDKTRSKNIAKMRREGYSEKRAVAAAYRQQRAALRRARHRRRYRRNPTEAMRKALEWLGIGALAGGAIGAFTGMGVGAPVPAFPNAPPIVVGAIGGALSGVLTVGLVGGVIGLVSPARRDEGFAMAGVGIGGYLGLMVVAGIIRGLSAPAG